MDWGCIENHPQYDNLCIILHYRHHNDSSDGRSNNTTEQAMALWEIAITEYYYLHSKQEEIKAASDRNREELRSIQASTLGTDIGPKMDVTAGLRDP